MQTQFATATQWRPAAGIQRTHWTIQLLIRLNENTFSPIRVLEPINFDVSPNQSKQSNPIPKILEWRDRLKKEENLTIYDIAKQENLTHVRISQLLEITKLKPNIIEMLAAEPQLKISLNSLRKLSRLSKTDQISHFQSLF